MKSILKLCMAISGSLFVIGISCIGIGISMGVTPAQLVYAGHYPGSARIQSGQQARTSAVSPEAGLSEPDSTEPNLPDLNDRLEEPDSLFGTNVSGAEEYYEFRDIQELELDLSLCKLNLCRHEADYIAVEADNVKSYFRCSQEGSTLCLEDDRPESTKSNSMKDALLLTLYLPDQTWKEISVETAVADISLDTLTADELEIENGVGNITIGTLKGKELFIHTGVGEFLADLIQADQEAEISVGTGNITLAQFDGASLTLDCGIGNAAVTAAGKEQDYNYTLDAALGSISLNRHPQSGRGYHHDSHDDQERHMDVHHGADRCIFINCGLGNASLDFMEE